MKEIHGGDIYRNHVEMDFSVNINPLGVPEEVKKALRKAVEGCQQYPDIMMEELQQAVGGMLGIPKEYLLFGNGASELFMAIVHAVKPLKTVIPIPSFYGYEYVSEAVGSDILYFPLKKENDFVPGEDLLEVLTEDTDLLFLANPNNPTGKGIKKEYLEKLLQVCRRKGIYVVLDECFLDFCENSFSFLSEVDSWDNLLIVRAFTKIFAIPGVRLGYLACGNKLLLGRIKTQLPEWNVSVFAQQAGLACAGQSAYVAATVEYVKREREFLERQLKKLGLQVFSGEADFVLIYCEKPLYERLLQRGILIRDCRNFRGLSEGYYRLAVKQRTENETLLKAIGESIE